MGEIYLAEDLHISCNVAVKVLQINYSKSETSREAERLFQREMKAISSLDHPHILPLFDYGDFNCSSAIRHFKAGRAR